jgi:hypothetical protein
LYHIHFYLHQYYYHLPLSAGLTALAAVNIEQSNEPLFPLLDAFALPEQQGLVMLQPLHVMKTLHFTLSGC